VKSWDHELKAEFNGFFTGALYVSGTHGGALGVAEEGKIGGARDVATGVFGGRSYVDEVPRTIVQMVTKLIN
jgi:hypothetical protein